MAGIKTTTRTLKNGFTFTVDRATCLNCDKGIARDSREQLWRHTGVTGMLRCDDASGRRGLGDTYATPKVD